MKRRHTSRHPAAAPIHSVHFVGVASIVSAITACPMAWGVADARFTEDEPAVDAVFDPEPVDELPEDIFSDELLLFADMPVVISASRRAVPINLSSVPISIVTAEDIHYSGLTRIDDILQFVPGVDSLRVDRNRVAVGVRGLHDFSSDRTLTLINGRHASNPIFGGPEFFRQPVFVHDIERIEVVRGPGGAAWGANAFNGVINIITKRPQDVRGVLLSTQMSIYGDSYSQARWANTFGDTSLRLSLGFENHRSSDSALGGADVTVAEEFAPLFAGANLTPRDFSRSPAIDTELVHQLSPDASLTVGLGYRYVERGDYEFVGYFPRENQRFDTLRAFVRFDTAFDNGASAYVQYYTNYLRSDQPSQLNTTALENDIEAQFNLPPWHGHELTLGGNVRYTHITSEVHDVQPMTYVGTPVDEYWAGLFLIDRWQVADRLTIETQLRGDYYSETKFDWSGRLTGLLAVDADEQHVLRLSGGRAFRAPLTGFRRLTVRRIEPMPDFFLINVDPRGDLRNEHIWSVEAGYAGRLADGLTLRVDGYWQRYRNLIGLRFEEDPFALGRQFFFFDNIDGATAYGLEAELAYEAEGGRVSAWYAFNEFDPQQRQQDIRSLLPARHKAGVSGRLNLPNDWTINANYKWSNPTPGNPSFGGGTDGYHRIDLALAKAFASGRGEVMIGVTDLLDQTSMDVWALGDLTSHPTPGRSAFVRLQVSF